MTVTVDSSGPEITLRMVFDHIVAMEQRLTARIERVETKVNRMDIKIDNNHRIVTTALQNIDDHLDAIEIDELPKIKKTLRVG